MNTQETGDVSGDRSNDRSRNMSVSDIRRDMEDNRVQSKQPTPQQNTPPSQKQDKVQDKNQQKRNNRFLIGIVATIVLAYVFYITYTLFRRKRDESLETPASSHSALPKQLPFDGSGTSQPPPDRNPYDVYACPIPWHKEISNWTERNVTEETKNNNASPFLNLQTIPIFDEQLLIGALRNDQYERPDDNPPVVVKKPPVNPPPTDPDTPTKEEPHVLTVEEVEEYINNRDPMALVDLGSIYCVDGANARFITGISPSTVVKDKEKKEEEPPQETPPNPPGVTKNNLEYIEVPEGYCIQKCDYAQRIQAEKQEFQVQNPSAGEQFNTVKDSDGNFRVQYELVLWANPYGRNQNGFRWYCRALPNKTYDGVGWVPNADGFYIRRAISPLFLNSRLDIFQESHRLDSIWKNGGSIGDLKRYPYTYYHNQSSPNSDSAKAVYYRLCASNPGGWMGDENTRNRPGGKSYKPGVTIGYNVDKWHYSSYQMIGSFCYNVGFDDGYDNIASTSRGNGHGDFAKLQINKKECERYRYITPDKKPSIPDKPTDIQFQSYEMRVTPGGLQCYACPNIYEFDEAYKRKNETNTWVGALYSSKTQLWGSVQDGFKCVRPCPLEFVASKSSVNGYMCIPNAVPMKERFPYARVRAPSEKPNT